MTDPRITFDHNPHKTMGKSVSDYLKLFPPPAPNISDSERQECVSRDELWVVETEFSDDDPSDFVIVIASTMEKAVAAQSEMQLSRSS